MTHLKARRVPPRVQWQLEQQGVHPLLARIYAARGIETRSELDYDLKALLPPAQLTHAAEASGTTSATHSKAASVSLMLL